MTGNLWFVRSDEKFLGWRLWMAKCERGHFAQAVPSPIAAPGLEADPTFIDGGRRLLFISTRATGTNRSADLDIWMSRRLKSGWSAPVRLPAPINSDKAEWFPRKAPDGWLYFGSARPGGEGGTDIWRVRQRHGEAWSVENLGPSVNTADHEYEFAVLPGGRRAILATDQGLYPVFRRGGKWLRGEKFDSQVNQNGTEIGPVPVGLDSDFLFSRDVGQGRSGELLAIRHSGSTGSPLRCLR